MSSFRNLPLVRKLLRCFPARRRIKLFCRKVFLRYGNFPREIGMAHDAAASGDWPKVASLLSPLIAAQQADIPDWLFEMLARARWQQGLLDEACKVLQRWISSHWRNRLGRGHPDLQEVIAHGDWGIVHSLLRSRIASSKRRSPAMAYVALALAQLHLGLLHEAAQTARSGIEEYPAHLGLQILNASVAIASKNWPLLLRQPSIGRLSRTARQRIFTLLPAAKHGSIVPGNSQWTQRWKEASTKKKVLMIAPKDFAGSMHRLAFALNSCTSYAARLVSFSFHRFGYPNDLMLPECDKARQEAFLELASEAGIFHLKDEHTWLLEHEFHPNLLLLKKLFFSDLFSNTPKVFTHYGSYARKFKNDSRYRDAVSSFDACVAFTPDLNFEWFKGEYIPHAIDTETIQPNWSDSKILAHSPSSRQKKSTDLLEGAVNSLKRNHEAAWQNWSLDIIHEVSHDECMRRKAGASLFFDQSGSPNNGEREQNYVVGWYSNSGVEAMAYGIPTIAQLSESAFQGAERAGVNLRDLPVINTSASSDGLVKAILSFVLQSPEEKRALSERTRQFVVDFHSFQSVGKRMAAVYDSLNQR